MADPGEPALPRGDVLVARPAGSSTGSAPRPARPVASIAPSSAQDSPSASGKRRPVAEQRGRADDHQRDVRDGRPAPAPARGRAAPGRRPAGEEIVSATIQNAEVSCPNWLYICMPSIPAAEAREVDRAGALHGVERPARSGRWPARSPTPPWSWGRATRSAGVRSMTVPVRPAGSSRAEPALAAAGPARAVRLGRLERGAVRGRSSAWSGCAATTTAAATSATARQRQLAGGPPVRPRRSRRPRRRRSPRPAAPSAARPRPGRSTASPSGRTSRCAPKLTTCAPTAMTRPLSTARSRPLRLVSSRMLAVATARASATHTSTASDDGHHAARPRPPPRARPRSPSRPPGTA